MARAATTLDKRTDLVTAATFLLHEQGFHKTTLADVAARARVPLGNVYYYFKTKEALAEAVLAAHEIALRARFAAWDAAHRDPWHRLRAYVRTPLDFTDRVIAFGCPHGSLCQELDKLGDDAPLARAGKMLFEVYLEWVATQYRALGSGKREARSQALDLVGAVQGSMLLANALRSSELLVSQVRRIERSLQTSEI